MELSQAHLRYLLAIGELSQGKAAVSSTQVARVLQVSRPSVTRMLAVLAEKDLVTKERYGKITLTETGGGPGPSAASGPPGPGAAAAGPGPGPGPGRDRRRGGGPGLSPAGALSPKALHDRIRRDNGMCHALKKQSCGFCRRTASFLEHRTIKEI